MSNARNLADLLDSNGDVVSGALDNAVPADGSITTAKLASTLDLSGKTVTLGTTSTTGNLVHSSGFTFGSGGITGGGKNDILGDWVTVYSNSSFALTSSAQTIFDNPTVGGLSTGAYLVKVTINGHPWYDANIIGVMSWYGGATNGTNASDIPIHSAGHALNGAILYCRTIQSSNVSGTNVRFQLWTNSPSTVNLTAYVRRIG